MDHRLIDVRMSRTIFGHRGARVITNIDHFFQFQNLDDYDRTGGGLRVGGTCSGYCFIKKDSHEAHFRRHNSMQYTDIRCGIMRYYMHLVI